MFPQQTLPLWLLLLLLSCHPPHQREGGLPSGGHRVGRRDHTPTAVVPSTQPPQPFSRAPLTTRQRTHLSRARNHFLALGATGVVVLHRGKLAVAFGDVHRNVPCHSVRKSLINALFGIYEARGKLSLSDTLGTLGIEENTPLTPREKSATIAHLLTSRSGIYLRATLETKKMEQERPQRGSHAPGTHWYYNNWDFNTLGTILEQVAGESLFTLFQREIAQPLGMEQFDPAQCHYRSRPYTRHRGYIFTLSTLDRARFGQLYLQNGRWNTRQLLTPDWIRRSTTSYVTVGRGVGYGYLWWIGTRGYFKRVHVGGPVYSARGVWGQYIVVLPKQQLVIAQSSDRQGGAKRAKGAHFRAMVQEFLNAFPAPPEETAVLPIRHRSPPTLTYHRSVVQCQVRRDLCY